MVLILNFKKINSYTKKRKPKRLPKWIYEGKEYYSDSAIARAYDISPATFSRKIRKGLSLEKALIKKDNSKRAHRKSRAKTFFTVGDKIFKNKREAAKFYNKDYRKVLNRLIADWDIDTIFGTLDYQILPLYIHGIEYNSVEDVCDVYKLNLREVYKRLKKGLSVKEIFNIENIDVLIVDNKETTIEEALKNIDDHLYSSRINRGWSVERALSTNTSKKKRKIGKVVRAYGKDYMSIKHMAEENNVPYSILLKLISCNKMDPEKALDKIKKNAKIL